jgi:hypothetical protein
VRLLATLALAGVTLSASATAGVQSVPPITYGVADDVSKYADDGGASFYVNLPGAGLTQNRWTLAWNPAKPTVIEELPFLERAAPRALEARVRVTLALYSKVASKHDPAAFCGWAGKVVRTVKKWGIQSFIVGNEPNTRLFWLPQKDAEGRDVAAPAFTALLARCYDEIKAANPAATVVGMGLSPRASTRESTEPLVFLRDVGKAYRASGRKRPLMDQLAIHPYPNPSNPTDAPHIGYPSPARYGISNLARVKQAVWDAFHGTAQPTTLEGLTFRIDEVGWQVDTTGLPGYVNRENVATINEPTQAAYLAQMVGTYFACDSAVTDVLLFLLVDERYRNGRDAAGKPLGGGWQSGLVTFGGQRRQAYAKMGELAARGRTACAGRTITWTPAKAGSKSR